MAAITFGLFTATEAQTAYDDQYYNDQQNTYNQPQQYYQPATVPDQQSFYYYPDANVYYDLSCGRYIYNNGYAWVSVNVLPEGFFLGNAPRVMVYHNGPRVWMDNAIHINAYNRPYREQVAFNTRGRFDNRQDFRHFDERGFNGRGGFDGHGFDGFREPSREAHYRR